MDINDTQSFFNHSDFEFGNDTIIGASQEDIYG
jgi:hypothetical protein